MSANPPFTDEHETLRESVRRFVANELRPHASEWEEARWFPDAVFGELARVGFLGLKYPEEYGGQGGDYLHDAVFAEEMARCGSGGVAAGVGAHVGIATPPVWKFGTEDQKRRYLAPPSPARRSPRWPSPSRARAPTSPRSPRAPSASTGASSSTARRPTSPTACARPST